MEDQQTYRQVVRAIRLLRFKLAQIKSAGLLGPEELKLEIAAYCVDALLDLVIQYYQEWQPKCLQKQWWAQIQKYYRRLQEFRYFSHI